jgi:hypothetical protein
MFHIIRQRITIFDKNVKDKRCNLIGIVKLLIKIGL